MSQAAYLEWYFENFFQTRARGLRFILYFLFYIPFRFIMRDERRMVVQRFLQKILSFVGEVPVEINGSRYLVHLRDLHDFDAFRDNCIKDTYRVANFIKPGMTVVDVGAHIGTFTLSAAAHVGESGRIFSFEPEKSNYDSLLKNISLNHLSRVEAFNAAVADHSGEMEFYLSKDSEGHSLVKENGPALGKTRVEVVALDEFSFGNVDVVKIDNEGSELTALKGAKKLLEDNPGITLLIEDSASHPKEELMAYLRDLGFVADTFSYFIIARKNK